MTCITNRYKQYLLLLACILLPFLLPAQELDTASVSVYADSVIQEEESSYIDNAAPEEPLAPDTEQEEVITHSLWDNSVPVNVDSMEEWWINGGLVERKVPKTVLSKLRADESLQYDKKETRTRRNDWAFRAMMSLVSFLQQIRMLIVILVIAGVLLLIVYFMRQQGFRFSARTADDDMPGTEDIDPGISGFEQQVQAAIAGGHFRQAVRFLHLQTLRIMADRELIVLSKDKTNADYLRMLLKTRWHQPFARLTRDYEYIWYGDVNVNAEQFNRIHGQFRQLMNELGLTR